MDIDSIITGIPNHEKFAKIESIDKGWSNDKKYYIETLDKHRLLLRVSEISEYEIKKAEFEMMRRVDALGISMSRPLDFGVSNDGESVYLLLMWCDGQDAEIILPMLTENEQYILGKKSGEILKKLHSLTAPKILENWDVRFNRKTDMKIKKYLECGIRFNGDEKVLAYIQNNRSLLTDRTQCYQHGDYHVGNMIISPDGTLSIIDFNRPDYGDPWEEFNRIVWSASVSPYFATGQINSYFGGRPPIEFFKLLAFYIASNTLSSIYWAIPFGQSDIDIMIKQSQDVLRWFNNMNTPMPTWYLEELSIEHIDRDV